MKKKFIILIGVLFILFSSKEIVYAEESAPYSPKNFIIIIENVKKEDIKRVDIINKSRFSFNYDKDISNKSTEEIDKLAIEINKYNKNDLDFEGYWLEENDLFSKWKINNEVTQEFKNNTLFLTMPTFQNSKEKNITDYGSVVRIVTKDNTVLYSEGIYSKLTKTFDEFATKEEQEQAYEVAKKDATYFVADYKTLTNNFKLEEVFQYETKTNSKIIIFGTIIITSLVIGGVFIYLKNKNSK